MKKSIVRKEVFIAYDGREFDTEGDAILHEAKITLFDILRKHQPRGKEYHAVYIPITEDKAIDYSSLNITNKEQLKIPGWNLIEDSGEKSLAFSIDYLMEQVFGTQKPVPEAPKVLPEAEQKSIIQLKKAIVEIIRRNTSLTEASPQAILGNLIMELQDLIRK